MNVEEYFLNFDPKRTPDLSCEWEKVREQMLIHTRGKVPEKLLNTRRPNEDDAVFNYRVSIYEPITKGPMNKAIDRLFRMFQGANYSIKVSEGLDNYLSAVKFEGDFFINYIQKKVLRTMIEDPNAVLVWVPYGPGIEDPSQKVEVYPELISSDRIHFIDGDRDFLTWLSEEKSEVIEGTRSKASGKVFYTMTEDAFFVTYQVGKKTDSKFETRLIYQHNIGQAPFVVLGGNLTS